MGNAPVYIFASSLFAACVLIQFFPQLGLLKTLGQIIILNIISQILWSTFICPIFLSPLRHIPGPKNGNILFGHAKQTRLSIPRGEYPRQWMDTIPNEGLLRFRDMFNAEGLIITSPALLKTVLNDNCYDYAKQPSTVSVLRPVLGDGLVLVEGDVHKFQRRRKTPKPSHSSSIPLYSPQTDLQPSFQGHFIRNLYPLFWSKASELTRTLQSHTHLPELELGVWNTRVTLDIIGVAGLGQDFSSLRNHDDPFVADYQSIMEPTKNEAFFFALMLIFPYRLMSNIPFWSIPRELKRISASLYHFGYTISRSRRAELANPKLTEHSDAKRNDILSLLVKSNDFSDHELAHQVLTMMAAGHETTSSALSWAIYCLASNPEIQTALREEIRAHLPSPSSAPGTTTTPSTANIDTLPLLAAICNETLRLHPVIHITSRQVIRPTQLGNYTLPQGTNVYIVPWAINRNTRFWGPDAETFNPYRWLDAVSEDDQTAEKTQKMKVNNHGGARSAYEFMTFLHGPRSCIGQG